MSNLQVFEAVALVVSAFHRAAELVTRIKKSNGRRDSKKEGPELDKQQLQTHLETAESQIASRYAADMQKFGDMVRIGDANARDRLLHIALVIQTDVIMSLQLAIKYENAPLDVPALREASVSNSKDAIDVLDELKQRVLLWRPLLRTFAGAPDDASDTRDAVQTAEAARSPVSSHVPDTNVSNVVNSASVGDGDGEKTGLARYFALKRRNESVSSVTSSKVSQVLFAGSIDFSPALHHLLQGKGPEERASAMKDIDEIIAAYQGLRVAGDRADALAILTGGHQEGPKRDTLAVLMGGDKRDTVGLHKEALQLLKNLPPTPGERQENFQYPAYNHNIFNQDDGRRMSQWAEEPKDLPAHSRWSGTSASSSLYSQHTASDPPSLYRYNSTSSHGSPIMPAEPETPHPSYNSNRSFSIQPSASSLPYDHSRQNRDAPPSHFATQLKPPGLLAGPALPSRTGPVVSSFAVSQSDRPSLNAVLSSQHGNLAPMDTPFQRPRTPVRDTPLTDILSACTTRPNLSSSREPSDLVPAPLALSRPNSEAKSTTSSALPAHSSEQQRMMDGRPCKNNNYWGFCKGAWGVREDLRRGLCLETRPEGLYNTSQIWQCKHCSFSGPSFTIPHPTKKNKKDIVVDPNIYVSAVGIRYRWLFLAKSHVKKKSPLGDANAAAAKSVAAKKGALDEDCNYGCVICSVQGNVTGIFGNVETLMNHIYMEHGRASGLSESVLSRSKCVIGRVAGADEEWDVNLPGNGIGF